ncbi:unnamed protein product [Xylocopa violacea]|uniref:Uncharacterized protein n=1 Tax=Xylocopa violacea TaxID=135666 RepID=A0ABP1MZB5_XYLVO
MDVNPTSEQIENCLEILQLLYSCSVVYILSFNDIVKYCFQSQQPHFAPALLAFLNDDDIVFVLNISISYIFLCYTNYLLNYICHLFYHVIEN